MDVKEEYLTILVAIRVLVAFPSNLVSVCIHEGSRIVNVHIQSVVYVVP